MAHNIKLYNNIIKYNSIKKCTKKTVLYYINCQNPLYYHTFLALPEIKKFKNFKLDYCYILHVRDDNIRKIKFYLWDPPWK